MKKHFILIFMLLAGSSIIFAQTKPLKIGYVDSQIILTQLPEAIKAQGDLDALTTKWTAQLDSMNKELQESYENYQKQAANMPDSKKQSVQQELLQKQQAIENFRREKFGQQNGEIYKKNEEIFAPIKKKIYKAIEDVAKQEDMKFIFDKSGDIILLYADEQFDITYKVLDNLRRGGK